VNPAFQARRADAGGHLVLAGLERVGPGAGGGQGGRAGGERERGGEEERGRIGLVLSSAAPGHRGLGVSVASTLRTLPKPRTDAYEARHIRSHFPEQRWKGQSTGMSATEEQLRRPTLQPLAGPAATALACFAPCGAMQGLYRYRPRLAVHASVLRHGPHVVWQPPFIEPEIHQGRDGARHVGGMAVERVPD
jgi:hypothetical protein